MEWIKKEALASDLINQREGFYGYGAMRKKGYVLNV
jgi:hypothetical protein